MKPSNIIFYGDVSGGFAALRALTYAADTSAVVVNPQTKLSASPSLDNLKVFLDKYWDGISVEEFAVKYKDKNSLWSYNEAFSDRRIVFIISKDDNYLSDNQTSQIFKIENGSFVPRTLNKCLLVLTHPHGQEGTELDSLPFLLNAVEDHAMIGTMEWTDEPAQRPVLVPF